jgi:hypothetical protein
MNTEITLPKQSLVLTTTNRTEIDKVLRELVTRTNIKLSLFNWNEYPVIIYETRHNELCNVTMRVINIPTYKECSTADEFLAHFEKPKFIEIETNDTPEVKVKVTHDRVIIFHDGYTAHIDINKIVNAQKQLI